ncbi:hypothetical protein C6P45_003349 [Maudiozyma exigua]|uniref:Uncharacterized protein n=1 Tax=Maudiozyma exigua TaxID=34358 RepID=A0A9P6VSQ3_MAUEX|nr:hypothetical protein C6P45_003349 [Kazachstania exigua]
MRKKKDNSLNNHDFSKTSSQQSEKLSYSNTMKFSTDCYNKSASFLSSRRLLNKSNRRASLILCLSIFSLILIIFQLSNTYNYNQDELKQFIYKENNSPFNFNHNNNLKAVTRKRDLLKIDITNLINDKDLSRTPITPHLLKQEYITNTLTGFVSNLELSSRERLDSALNLNIHNNATISNSNKISKKISETTVNLKELETKGRKAYDSLVTCQDLSYNGTIEHAVINPILSDDLMSIRRELLKYKGWLTKEVKDDKDKDKTEEEIIQKQWFRFGGSSVWLESEQCFLVFTRILYSRIALKVQPHISLIRAQAFDKDWNEIIGKKIPYIDIDLPDNMDSEIEKLDIELNIEDCSKYSTNTVEFETCNIQQAKTTLKKKKRKEHIVSKYYVTYPTTFDFHFDAHGDLKGPEDPHIILRKTETTEEPVIIFNMHDDIDSKRRMFSYMPHRKIDPMMKLKIEGRKMRDSEKNWTPFFHPSDQAQSVLSRGSIYFIYSFSPLDIIKCSLNDGFCEVVFDQQTLAISDSNTFGGMRGGTQFIPLPPQIPNVENKNIWVGFPKLHIDKCGCGDKFYRPMLDVLIESNGIYHQELIVPAMDLDIEVLSWDAKSTDCEGKNVLNPNSITHWDIAHQDPISNQFEDYMTLTLSESDSFTKIVTLKGILNYVLGIYRVKNMKEDFFPSEESNDIVGKTLTCLVDVAKEHCSIYGKMHQALNTKGE